MILFLICIIIRVLISPFQHSIPQLPNQNVCTVNILHLLHCPLLRPDCKNAQKCSVTMILKVFACFPQIPHCPSIHACLLLLYRQPNVHKITSSTFSISRRIHSWTKSQQLAGGIFQPSKTRIFCIIQIRSLGIFLRNTWPWTGSLPQWEIDIKWLVENLTNFNLDGPWSWTWLSASG